MPRVNGKISEIFRCCHLVLKQINKRFACLKWGGLKFILSKLRLVGSFALIALLLLAPLDNWLQTQVATAAINQQINYQGKLTDSSGDAVADATYSIVFSLYTTSTGGSNIWTETQSVTATSGLFSVMLGSVTSLASVNFNQTLYLGVNVASDGEMTPRKILGAVPAAFEAKNSDTLDGLTATDFLYATTTNATATITTLNVTGLNVSNSTTTNATTTYLNVSSTASTSALIVSGNASLQTITSGIWNGTAIGAVYGGTGLSSVSANQILIGNSAGTGWTQVATSSLNIALSDTVGTLSVSKGGTGATTFSYGLLLGNGTDALTNIATSSLGLLTTNVAEGSNLYYLDSRVNSYIHASTTIAKAYSDNTFTGSNIFNGALTISTLNGPLQANGGLVSATTSIGVLYGGTGLTTAPAYGEVLLGNGSGGYTLTATTSLGITAGGSGTVNSGTTGYLPYYASDGTTLTATSSLYLNTAGNFGISSSSPYAKLSVTNAGSGYSFIVEDDTADATPFSISNGGQMGVRTNLDDLYGDIDIGGYFSIAAADGYYTDITNNAYYSSGWKSRQGGPASYIQMNGGVNKDSSINFLVSSLATTDPADTAISWNTAMLIDKEGDVGIASTTPYAKLSVTNTGSNPSFLVEDSTSPDATPFIISATGLVGIGTASPVGLLEIGSTAGQSIRFQSASSTKMTSGLGLRVDTSYASHLDAVGDFYVNLDVDANTTNSFYITDGAGDTRLTVQEAGNVGIGTTTPTQLLELRTAGVLGPVIKLDAAEAGAGAWGLVAKASGNAATGDFGIYDFDASSYRLNITSAGKVGIGTVTPGTRLQIINGSTVTDYPTLGTASGILSLGGFSQYGLDIGVWSTGNSWMQTHRFDGTGTAYDLILQPSGGNVGVGTVSPDTRLDVTGTAGTTIYPLILQADNANNGTLLFGLGSSVGPRILGNTNSSGNVSVAAAAGGLSLGGNGLQILTSDETTGARVWDTRMTVVPSTGYVGIGTASPSVQLDVYENSASASVIEVGNTEGVGSINMDNTQLTIGNAATNGSIWLQANGAGVVYLNRFGGTGGVQIGDGTTNVVAQVTSAGILQIDSDLRVDGGDIGLTADTDLIQLASGAVTINGSLTLGTDLALASGGTGTTLTDPGADRIMFWDDSAGVVTWLTAGSGLSISGTTITATGGSPSGSNGEIQFNSSGSFGADSDLRFYTVGSYSALGVASSTNNGVLFTRYINSQPTLIENSPGAPSDTYISSAVIEDQTGANAANTYISVGSSGTLLSNIDGGDGGTVTMVAGGDATSGGTDGSDGTVNIGYSLGTQKNANLNLYGDLLIDRATDGTLIDLKQGGTSEGSISVSGTTVSYNAFTGSHYAWTNKEIGRGTLVRMTGDNLNNNNDHEIVYGIEESTEANDPTVLGSYLGILDKETHADTHLVMAVGNGYVWLVDNGENVNRGDYLISSDTKGHAMKDLGNYEKSYVIARVAEDIDWEEVTEMIDGKKHTLVSVFFENFVSRGTTLSTLVAGGDIQATEPLVFDMENGEIKVFSTFDFQGQSIKNIASITSFTGTWSISEEGVLVADDIQTNKLTVQTGVTTKDKTTGEYYCIYVDDGALQTEAGKCEDLNLANDSSESPDEGGSDQTSTSTEDVVDGGGDGETPPPSDDSEPTPEPEVVTDKPSPEIVAPEPAVVEPTPAPSEPEEPESESDTAPEPEPTPTPEPTTP